MMGIMKKDDIPGLFSALADRPLADRLRPSALEDIMGQDHLLGEGGPLRLMADSRQNDQLYPMGAARLRENHAGAHSGDAHIHAFRSSLRRLLRHGGFEKSL